MAVLIVDDDVDIRETLRDVLEDEGFEVAMASNGIEAMTCLGDRRDIRVVVLDLAMPLMDGEQVYRAMRADPRLARIPVVVATSDPTRAPTDLPLMKKPIRLDRLIELVQRHAA